MVCTAHVSAPKPSKKVNYCHEAVAVMAPHNGRRKNAYEYALELMKDGFTYESVVKKHCKKSEFKSTAPLFIALSQRNPSHLLTAQLKFLKLEDVQRYRWNKRMRLRTHAGTCVRIIKNGGIEAHSIPAHTSGTTQPLDGAIYSPFKAAINDYLNTFGKGTSLRSNEITKVALYDMFAALNNI